MPPERREWQFESAWYQKVVRQLAACGLALMCVACGQDRAPEPASPPPEMAGAQINPVRIERIRDALPPGYEVSGYTAAPTPLASWSMADASVALLPQCLALAAPPVEAVATRGWSASGPGGIVFAVVAGADALTPPDAGLLTECAEWTLTSAHTTGNVTVRSTRSVSEARAISMTAALSTVVEGGTQTRSRADTFVAYLGNYLCFVTLVTDPGSPGPDLPPDFAADLLVSAVAALRG